MNGLPVLTFHSLDDSADTIAVPPRVFTQGLARLNESGHRCIGLQDLTAQLRQGMPLPPRSFALTFDDGFANVYDTAFPVLQALTMSATVFLIVTRESDAAPQVRLPSYQGRPMLSWGEIREMHRYGIAFGAHTLTHPDLTRLPLAKAATEIRGSKEVLEDALGSPVTSFAYPYGRYSQAVRDLVQQHFDCACSDKLGLVTGKSDLLALERVDAYYLRTDTLFSWLLHPSFPWYVRARSVPRALRRAIHWRPE